MENIPEFLGVFEVKVDLRGEVNAVDEHAEVREEDEGGGEKFELRVLVESLLAHDKGEQKQEHLDQVRGNVVAHEHENLLVGGVHVELAPHR